MVKLHFNTTEEFETLFKNKSLAVTDTIYDGIEEAMKKGDNTAMLFELSFADTERAFEMSLPQSQWVDSLESCLNHYHELELGDKAIDAWKLLEAAKLW